MFTSFPVAATAYDLSVQSGGVNIYSGIFRMLKSMITVGAIMSNYNDPTDEK